MTAPDAYVEVAFGSTWQTEPADMVWTNLTGRVLHADGLSTSRGASAARGQVDAGKLDLSFLNSDRELDPTHADGDHFGDLLPGVPIRVVAAVGGDRLMWDGESLTWAAEELLYGATLVPVWYGTVAKWPQRGNIGNKMGWVPIEAWDGFDKLSRAKIPRSVLDSEILSDNPIGYWKLDEGSGSAMVDSSGNKRHGVYTHGTIGLRDERELPGGGQFRGIDFDGEHEGLVDDIAAALAGRPFSIFGLVQVPFDGSTTNSGVVLRCGSGHAGNSPTSRNMEVSVTATAAGLDIIGYARDGDASDGVAAQDLSVGISEPCVFTFRRAAAGAAQMWVNGANETDITTTTAAAFPSHPGVSIGSESNVAGGQDALTGWLSHVAFFQSDLGTARIAELASIADAPLDGQTTDERITWILDELDWPTDLRDLEIGNTILGPAAFEPGDGALSYLRLVAASEDGALFIGPDGVLRFLDRFWRYLDPLATVSQFTFTDQDGDQGYAEFDLDLDDELLVNVARFTRRGGTEQVAVDQASADQYGEAESQQSDLLQRSDAEVRALAEWTVATRSVPLPRVPKIRVPLHRYSEADQATVLGLDLGHRVTCERTPQGVGDPISLSFQIDGLRNDIGAGEWWWEAYVSPVPEDTVSLFVLDESELDGVDVLAY